MAQASGAYITGDYESALMHAQRASAAGEPRGSTFAGHMYLHGLGTDQSDELAVLWFERAAERGEPDALIALSGLAEAGRGGLTQGQAGAFLQQAADTGDIRAAFEYGVWLMEQGDPGQARLALDWMRLSAEAGHVPAYSEYAVALDQWVHGPRDPSLALPWYIRAGNAGDAHAALQVGLLKMEGAGVEQNRAEGVQWVKQAAEMQLPSAMGQLALLYFQGAPSLPADPYQAVVWAQRGAEGGDAEAQFLYGYALATGEGVQAQDLRNAYLWILRAGQPGPLSLADDPQRQQLEAALERALGPEVASQVQTEAIVSASSF